MKYRTLTSLVFALLIFGPLQLFPDPTVEDEIRSIHNHLRDTTIDDSTRDFIREVEKRYYTWKYEEMGSGYMITLDLPYPNFHTPVDVLSLTWVGLSGDRLKFFTIAGGDHIDVSKGMHLHFNSVTTNESKDLPESVSLPAPLAAEQGEDFFRWQFVGLNEEKEANEADLLEAALEHRMVVFAFQSKNGETFRVPLPLHKFQELYQEKVAQP